MGYAIVIGSCVACHKTVHFNPLKVPSIRINGEREPLCRNCFERWCTLHPDAPRPNIEGAYDAVPEETL